MDFDGSEYYTLNRMMLRSIGLWPYQNVWFIRIQRVFCLIHIVSFIMVQLFVFATFDYNFNLLLEILSYVIPSLIVIVKYTAYCMKTESIKKLLGVIKYDWNVLKDKMENDIIHKYTRTGMIYSQLFALIANIFPFFFGFMHCIPNFLDLVAPFNESRPHQLLILTEYFVDKDKYFYLILLHMTICIFILLFTLMSTTSMFIAYLQHVCGMFEIACYRIEHALEKKQTDLIFGKHCVICTKIISAVDIHRRAIDFFDFMRSSFLVMYLFVLVLGVASLTVNLYRVINSEEIFDIILSVANVSVHLFYFFFANYLGQKILDYSNDFLVRTYNIKWHVMPLHVQKLILFIMQRSSKSCMLLVGGLYVASLEGFATTMSTSMSYLLVIYSSV